MNDANYPYWADWYKSLLPDPPCPIGKTIVTDYMAEAERKQDAALCRYLKKRSYEQWYWGYNEKRYARRRSWKHYRMQQYHL